MFYREDVQLIFKTLNPNKAPVPDGNHQKVLKNCIQSLAYPLSVLLNLSFLTGCIALVVPVHKKGRFIFGYYYFSNISCNVSL